MSTDLMLLGDAWRAMKEQSGVLVRSGFLPQSVKTPEQAIAIMMMGRELGIGPMEAFSKISIIQGKPTIGAELQKALVHKKLPGSKFDIVKSDKTECVIEAARPGGKAMAFSFTWEDATSMRLVDKDNWKKMPKVMLRWRCISEVCRAVFPDCLSGASHTAEELNPDLELNEQGEIIDVKATNNSHTQAPPKQEDKPAAKTEKKESRIYTGDMDNKDDQEAWTTMTATLKARKVPDHLWPEVEIRMRGKTGQDFQKVWQDVLLESNRSPREPGE